LLWHTVRWSSGIRPPFLPRARKSVNDLLKRLLKRLFTRWIRQPPKPAQQPAGRRSSFGSRYRHRRAGRNKPKRLKDARPPIAYILLRKLAGEVLAKWRRDAESWIFVPTRFGQRATSKSASTSRSFSTVGDTLNSKQRKPMQKKRLPGSRVLSRETAFLELEPASR
jgi:hypothetical protein